MRLVEERFEGLYVPAGQFYVDPRRAVPRAVVTHAHSDHAVRGCGSYLCARSGQGLLQERLGPSARIESLPFGERLRIGEVEVSLHPAGHLLGSAQVRLEVPGEIAVITGDYKRDEDASCEAFEPVRCDTLYTETTFAQPQYHWPSSASVFEEIHQWWRSNRQCGLHSVLLAYSLGKAQRLLAGLRAEGPVLVHSAAVRLNRHYVEQGIALVEHGELNEVALESAAEPVLAILPSQAASSWLGPLGLVSVASASGWNHGRHYPSRRSRLDRGFVLSDHADWEGLCRTIEECGASRVGLMHGDPTLLLPWCRQQGLEAWAVGHGYERRRADPQTELAFVEEAGVEQSELSLGE